MDDDGTQRRSKGMDLNLYLGLPNSPRPIRPDLGSDLALSSPPMLPAEHRDAETAAASIAMDAAPLPVGESSSPSPGYPPYFPSHAQEPLMDAISLGEPVSQVVLGPTQLGGEIGMPYSPPYVAPSSAYLPPYVTASTTRESQDEVAFSFCPSPPIRTGEVLGSRTELLRYPELRIRRLIESHRLRARQLRSSLPHVAGSSNFPSLEPLHDIMCPQGLGECTSKEVLVEGVATMEAGLDEKGKGAANFECNICLDTATEPVVTSCGHLFCWPCLYKWLHVHSHHKECPVCKGDVTEANITPIYGRGSSEASVEKKLGEEGESDVKIPPRPHGNRVESFRQQLRPVSRRLGEGIASSWRRLLDQQQQVRNRNRLEGNVDPALPEILDTSNRRALARLRSRRMQRGEDGSTLNSLGGNTSSVFQDGIDLWHHFSLYGLASTERLAALTAEMGRVVGQFASISNHYGASTSSVNPTNFDAPINGPHVAAALATDQASASSTMAVIQDDVVILDGPVEPNNGGSSRSHSRRGRSSTGSLDVDGGALHASKRRRLN